MDFSIQQDTPAPIMLVQDNGDTFYSYLLYLDSECSPGLEFRVTSRQSAPSDRQVREKIKLQDHVGMIRHRSDASIPSHSPRAAPSLHYIGLRSLWPRFSLRKRRSSRQVVTVVVTLKFDSESPILITTGPL